MFGRPCPGVCTCDRSSRRSGWCALRHRGTRDGVTRSAASTRARPAGALASLPAFPAGLAGRGAGRCHGDGLGWRSCLRAQGSASRPSGAGRRFGHGLAAGMHTVSVIRSRRRLCFGKAGGASRGIGQNSRHRFVVGFGQLLPARSRTDGVTSGSCDTVSPVRHRGVGRLGDPAVCPCRRICPDRRRGPGACAVAGRHLGRLQAGRSRFVRVEITLGQPVPNDLQGQEVLTLLAEHPTESFDVMLEELAVPRGGSLGVDQTLALEEADFGDGDVGELLAEQRQDITDGEVRPAAHSLPATRYTSLNLPIWTSSPGASFTSSMRSRLT